jgi:molybdopterin-binding protein
VLGPEIRSLLDSGGSLENLLDGRLEGSALRVGSGMKVWVPASQSAGERAVFTVRPEDVLVSLRTPEDLSARNALPGEVVAIHEIGPDVVLRIDVDGFEWLSKLTRVAAQQLGVTPGVQVFVVVKTHSFRRLS